MDHNRPGWNVSRGEFVQPWGRILNRNTVTVLCCIGSVTVLNAGVLVYTNPSADYLLIAGLGLPVAILGVFSLGWWIRTRRWKKLAEEVWDADGCICPWCRTDVRSHPCGPHGVGSSNRDLLVDYYTSKILGSSLDALHRLKSAVPRPPRRLHLLSGPIRWFARQFRAIRSDETAAATRTGIILKISLLWFTLLLIAMPIVILLVPGSLALLSQHAFVAYLALVLAPVSILLNPKRVGPRACRKCRQKCHSLGQTTCAECGEDLRPPGAIVRNKSRAANFWPVQASLVGLLALPWVLSPIVDVLPHRPRNALRAWTGAPTGHFLDLDLPNMTDREIQAEADLLLLLCRPGGPGVRFTFDRHLIHDGLAAGRLPESYREDAARLTISASIELESTHAGQEIVVHPSIEPSLLGDHAPRLAFGGVSIDGGPWSRGADWSLTHEDCDPWWRSHADDSTRRPRSQITFRVPVELEPGPHDIRARCWIVIDGEMWNPLDVAFDSDGEPIFSDTATVYDLPLAETIGVP